MSDHAHAARIEYVRFNVQGHNDVELHEHAREVLAAYSTIPHGYRMTAESKYSRRDTGEVIMWEGEVTAWPDEP